MKIWMIVFFLGLGITVHAQEVIKDGKVYEVKGKAIFHEGEDVTASLLSEEKADILKSHKSLVKEAKDAEKARKKAEKELKQREKAQKKAEKAQKKAEKELKKKEKALDRYNKANYKLEQSQSKYEILKKRGRLSPVDESKWIKKLDGLREKVEKARRKL